MVDHLEELAGRQDRAALARLRASLQDDRKLEGLAIVLPFVGRHNMHPERAEDDALLVAGLFALHPESGHAKLPMALRLLSQTSDSVELRFRALLAADRVDLGPHLRHAVGLVASQGHPLDWRDIHRTVRFWDHHSNRSRREWARAFWAATEDAGSVVTEADERIMT
ncbi:MAG: type I-E CRISPR-associated protein Cse2/CasB [Vicinamibacterales bacterium]